MKAQRSQEMFAVAGEAIEKHLEHSNLTKPPEPPRGSFSERLSRARDLWKERIEKEGNVPQPFEHGEGPVHVRRANILDAVPIARVHVLSWLETYAGILDDEFIKKRTPLRRFEQWSKTLSQPDPLVFVAVVDNEVVGFANGAPVEKADFEGELCACYLLKKHQGIGLGYELCRRVVEELHRRGMRNNCLDVLADNPSRGFYERIGCQRVPEINGMYGDREVWCYRLPDHLQEKPLKVRE